MKVIKSYTELNELHQQLRKFDVYHKGEKYKVQLPQLDAEENNRITGVVNNYSKKCGGNTKNFVMAAAFAFYTIYYFSKGGTFSAFGVDELISLTAYTLSGAIMGKLSGLIYIRCKMIKFVGRLLASEDSASYQHGFLENIITRRRAL
jgi:hypothetical protein